MKSIDDLIDSLKEFLDYADEEANSAKKLGNISSECYWHGFYNACRKAIIMAEKLK